MEHGGWDREWFMTTQILAFAELLMSFLRGVWVHLVCVGDASGHSVVRLVLCIFNDCCVNVFIREVVFYDLQFCTEVCL